MCRIIHSDNGLDAGEIVRINYSAYPYAFPYGLAALIQIRSRRICRTYRQLYGMAVAWIIQTLPCRINNALGTRCNNQLPMEQTVGMQLIRYW